MEARGSTVTGSNHSTSLYNFSLQERSYRLLAASLPLLNDDLALYIKNDALPYSQANLPLYEDARISVVFDEDMYPEVDFQALNTGEGYGLLRVRDPDDRPHPREIVVYEALPHELPRVAGIVTYRAPNATVAYQPACRPRRRAQRLHP